MVGQLKTGCSGSQRKIVVAQTSSSPMEVLLRSKLTIQLVTKNLSGKKQHYGRQRPYKNIPEDKKQKLEYRKNIRKYGKIKLPHK